MSSTQQSQSIQHRILEVLVAHPNRDLTCEFVAKVLADPDWPRQKIQYHLANMAKNAGMPVRHTSWSRYRYSSKCKAAVALKAYAAAAAAPSQIDSEGLAAPEAVETTEALPVFAETTVALVPEHAPVLGGEWERIKRVPTTITNLMPLKDTESLVVTEDGRYFILSELVN